MAERTTRRKENVADPPGKQKATGQPLEERPRLLTKEQEEMYKNSRGLVFYFGKKFFSWGERVGVPAADIISAGDEGLMRAVQTYDEEKGKLSPYAKLYIEQKIHRLLENKTDTAKAKGQLRSYEDMMPEDMRKDMPANDPGALGAENPNLADELGTAEEAKKVIKAIDRLHRLSARDKTILRMWLQSIADGQQLTYEQIGKNSGRITRERVRQIIENGLGLLRKRLWRLDHNLDKRLEQERLARQQRVETRIGRDKVATAGWAAAGEAPPKKPTHVNPNTVHPNERPDLLVPLYFYLRHTVHKQDPEAVLRLIVLGPAEDLVAAFKQVFPDIDSYWIQNALRAELSRFECVKGQWKWKYSSSKPMLIVALKQNFDPYEAIGNMERSIHD